MRVCETLGCLSHTRVKVLVPEPVKFNAIHSKNKEIARFSGCFWLVALPAIRALAQRGRAGCMMS